MGTGTRRGFMQTSRAGSVGAGPGMAAFDALAQVPRDRPQQGERVPVFTPRTCVPLSRSIRDATRQERRRSWPCDRTP